MEPVRLSSQFLYHSKREAISELKDAFFYADIRGVEPVAFDKNGYLIEKRETKTGSKSSVNEDIRLSPFPLAKYLMAVYLVDKNGFKIKRNAKISNRLWLVRES
jgi:hypothetical protein